MNSVECPSCDGKGMIMALLHHGDGVCDRRRIPCYRCKGHQTIPVEMLRWIEIGRAMRTARLEAGLSQREAAKQIGIDDMKLSKMEQGIVRPIWPSVFTYKGGCTSG